MKASLFVLLSILTSVLADHEVFGRACYLSGSNFRFTCKEGIPYHPDCYCQSDAYIATVMDCLRRTALNQKDFKGSFSYFHDWCEQKGKISISLTEAEQILNRLESQFLLQDHVNKTKPVTQPISLTDLTISGYVKSAKSRVHQIYLGELFGGLTMAYWGLVIAIGSLINLARIMRPKTVLKVNSPSIVKFRKLFTMPAAFRYKHSVPLQFWKFFRMTIPTRSASLILVGYGIMCLILIMVEYKPYQPNAQFKTKGLQLSRDIGVRASLMAVSQFPPMFLFAGRNNMMMLVTGWSFHVFNIFHRWCSRSMFIFAVIHAGCYTYFYTESHIYHELLSEGFFRWGIAAICIVGVIMFQTLGFFRARVYEIFLLLHIVLVTMFVVSIWYHVKPSGYMYWTYCAIAIWLFDRMWRLLRLINSGVHSKAQIQIYSGKILKMKISYSGRWKAYPGAHVYLHVLGPWKFWESHPFIVYESPNPHDEGKLVVCCSAKAGMTKRLVKNLANKPHDTETISVLIDGPHGSRNPIDQYDTVIFISGGSGLTSIYAYASDLIKRQYKGHVIFIWTVRSYLLHCFDEEIRYLSENGLEEITIYVTDDFHDANEGTLFSSNNVKENDCETGYGPGIEGTNETEEGTLEEKYAITKSPCQKSNSAIKVVPARPLISNLIPSYLSQCKGTVGVMCCGPPRLNDDVRLTVTRNLGAAHGRVDYFEESFSW